MGEASAFVLRPEDEPSLAPPPKRLRPAEKKAAAEDLDVDFDFEAEMPAQPAVQQVLRPRGAVAKPTFSSGSAPSKAVASSGDYRFNAVTQRWEPSGLAQEEVTPLRPEARRPQDWHSSRG